MTSLSKPHKTDKLIIVSDSAFAEIAYEYFTYDSPYEVVAFSVERDFLKRTELLGLPVLPFEELETHFDPASHFVYAANVYTQLNRLRTRLSQMAKQKGFRLASYISSRAFVWQNVQLGEHCFIFENNVIQPFVKLGDNVILWSGNHIGHHSTIGDNCFVSSHVVVSGFVNVEPNCFLGVNSTLVNHINIAQDSWIGPGVVITKDTEAGTFYKPQKPEQSSRTTWDFFNIPTP